MGRSQGTHGPCKMSCIKYRRYREVSSQAPKACMLCRPPLVKDRHKMDTRGWLSVVCPPSTSELDTGDLDRHGQTRPRSGKVL